MDEVKITMMDTLPTYNLKAVIKETGLSPATLRAWERRYGLVNPGRSPGGHRLYSRQDIELLKWLVARQKDGLSISRAVEMWKAQLEYAPSETQRFQPTQIASGAEEGTLTLLRDRWIEACMAFDDLGANQALDQAFAIASPATVCLEVLKNGLAQVGQGWYRGLVSIQQEHFASSQAMRRIDNLIAALPAPTRGKTILAACPAGEQHDFILLLVTYLLRRSGWEVVYLGANVPVESLDTAMRLTQPVLVISAAQTLMAAATLRDMSRYLVQAGIPLAYGGGIFSALKQASQCISGYYLGTDLAMLPGIIELLVIAPPEMPDARPLPPEYPQYLANFRQSESAIITQTTAALQGGPIEPGRVQIANAYLTRMITAALQLGDIHLVDYAVAWLDGLLENYGYAPAAARQFYRAYRQALESYPGLQSSLIVDWLKPVSEGIEN